MIIILVFFFTHWFLSLFFHSFFLHRFASHQMYTTSKSWERIFYVATWLVQGSSFLVPRAYAVMHRMHHTYSDTEKDPHSPHFFTDVYQMMRSTILIFRSFLTGKNKPEQQFLVGYLPVWDRLDKFGHHAATRVVFMFGYVAFYMAFAPGYWWFLLLPIHFLMGPIQGAVVNWCGHKYGYSNFNNGDHSKNTSPWGILLMGELFQNNHHFDKEDANFARKWFEFDLTFQVMRSFNALGVIQFIKEVDPIAIGKEEKIAA
ncbi:fatty acid desaturase [Parasediminibacterium sp. JCM 36343]|uniref:fatty acid desaturase n=1 Tax=Parasediminibacterium sp. JCM 36343 TaxID=3374279 RepID=UPI00397C3947